MFAWRTAGRLLLVLIALTAFAGSASAQLPPDQRRQMRQEMRDYWRQAPPDTWGCTGFDWGLLVERSVPQGWLRQKHA